MALASFGCAPQHKDAVMFGVNTTGGLKVGVDERQVPIVIIGYSRQEAAMVPLFVYGDGMFNAADRDVDTTTYLEEAKRRFEDAETVSGTAQTKLIEEGILLVNWAYEAAQQKLPNGNEPPPVSPGLKKLHTLAQETDPSLTELKLLTTTEIQRPSTALRYLDEYKYIGELKDEGAVTNRSDAYSVLGTFTGSAKGKATTPSSGVGTEASGSIAQYFATGIAAQILSRTPAAVSSNSEAVREASNAIVQSDAFRSGRYVKDTAGDALRRFWQPDGETRNLANEQRIKDWIANDSWMQEHNYTTISITLFMRGQQFAETRQRAAQELGLIP